MRYFVNENCIGCGLCVSVCPEVFTMTEAGLAEAAREADTEAVCASAQEAAESCPVNAIEER